MLHLFIINSVYMDIINSVYMEGFVAICKLLSSLLLSFITFVHVGILARRVGVTRLKVADLSGNH